MPDHKNPLGRIEFILAALALIGIFSFLQLSMMAELVDPDVWLHLKTGQYILTHMAVPHTGLFSSTAPSSPWLDHSVLTQVVFYLAFKAGGPDALILTSCLVMLLAFLFLFFCAFRSRKLLTLSVIMLSLAVFASKIRFNIRPENFSVLFFCIYLFILTRYKNKKWLFLLPFLQAAWAGFHGFFILGPLLIALFIAAEALNKTGRLPWQWSTGEALEKNSWRNLLLTLVLSLFACLFNPNGVAGAVYPFKIIFHSLEPDLMRTKINELMPPWQLSYDKIFVYYLLLAVSSFSFLLNLKKINLAYLLSWIVILAASFNISRNIIFFNCVAFLAAVDNFSRLDYPQLWKRKLSNNFILLVKCIVLCAIVVGTSRCVAQQLSNRYYIFDQHRFKSLLLGVSTIYPEKAADFIKKNRLPDNLFNIFNHGSYLIYRLWPQNHVFIDGRTEIYSKEFFRDYYTLLYTDAYTAGRLLEKYGVNTVVLTGRLSTVEDLAEYLNSNKEWALVYFNDDGLIFVRDNAANKELVKRLRIDPGAIPVKNGELKKLGLLNIIPYNLTRLAQMFFILGQDKKALEQAREALQVYPDSAEAYAVAANVYLRKADLKQAFIYVRLAAIYGPDNVLSLLPLADYHIKSGENEKAAAVYRHALELYPDAKMHYLLGSLYAEMGRTKEAYFLLKKASKLAPFSSEYSRKLEQLSRALAR